MSVHDLTWKEAQALRILAEGREKPDYVVLGIARGKLGLKDLKALKAWAADKFPVMIGEASR